MIKDIQLLSSRLLLRELEIEDVSATYQSWLEDPLINQYLETRFEEQTIERITAFVDEQKRRKDSYLFGIFTREDDRHIGNIKLGSINFIHETAQISFFIGDRSSWGHGFARESVSMVVEWGFNKLGLVRVEAGCYEQNFASLRVLLSCGFEVEGFFRKSRLTTDGSRSGSFWLGKLAP